MFTNRSNINVLHFNEQSLNLEKDNLHILQEKNDLIFEQIINLQTLKSILLKNL